jgi:hypothetical protein
MKSISASIIFFSAVFLFHSIVIVPEFYQGFICVTASVIGLISLRAWLRTLKDPGS